MTLLRPLVVFFIIALGLPSCQLARRFAKATPAHPSPFLRHPDKLKHKDEDSPFYYTWRNTDKTAWAAAEPVRKLWIAPVSLEHLRPITKALSRLETNETTRRREAAKLAEFARAQFISAFKKSPKPRFEIVDAPSKDALTLELALIELNPNPILGGITRKAINIAAVPGAESLVGGPLKGSTSIEGRLTHPARKQDLYEFSDTEQNRSALFLSVYDYTRYSLARRTITTWADQFEQVSRTPFGKVKDTPAFMIWLW